MAHTPFSLLLAKRLSLSFHLRKASTFFFLSRLLRPFSTSQTSPTTSSSSDAKPSSLSARMSFIFDQIDSIEKERSQKDQTLQRIRAWRENKKSENASLEARKVAVPVGDENRGHVTEPGLELDESKGFQVAMKNKEVELVHPWPEWIEFLERLVQQNYFDHRRKDEDRMVQELGYDPAEVAIDNGVGTDFLKDFKTVHTACLNFGKDRFDILRSLSRQDIQILVGFGCPNVDKKVVFSAKLLRKFAHLDEGDVCSSCSLRNSCERAYLITNKEDEARTIDVIRVLLTFGFDPWNGSVVNDSLLKKKSVKTVVRKLLHGVVKLSSVPIDPNLPFPVIKRPPPKVKQPPPPPRRRVGRDDIEMKKGDWLCPKCDFMNFSKNTVCLQCDAKRPKRQLLPGEWECPECNFLNYRRNVVCFHCECKRPPDEYMENKMEERQQGSRNKLEKIASRQEVSNAWNFDFDDNESDGADVAAFEYADSSVRGGISSLDDREGGNLRKFDDNLKKFGRGLPDGEFSDKVNDRPGMGFNDFQDEEDDCDSYEPDTPNNSEMRSASIAFSDVEGSSESEDAQDYNHNVRDRGKMNFSSKIPRQRAAFSDSEGDEVDDEELAVGQRWKASHVSDTRQKSRGRGSTGRSRDLRYGSDEDLGLYSDMDDDSSSNFRSRKNNGGKMTSSGRDFRGRRTVNENRFSSGSDIDDDDQSFGRQKFTGNNRESGRRNDPKSRGGYKFSKEHESRSPNVRSRRMDNFKNDFDRKSLGSHASGRRFGGGDRDGQRSNASGRRFGGGDRDGQRSNASGRRFGGGDRDGQRSNASGRRFGGGDRDGQRMKNYGTDFSGAGKPSRMQRQQRPDDRDWGKNMDDSEFRNSRRVIER